jgi:hypothetical protein
MRRVKIGLTVLVSVVLMGCSKTNILPDETIVGRNTLGYVVNDDTFGNPFGAFDDAFIFGDNTIDIISDSRDKGVFSKVDYYLLSFSLSHNGSGSFAFTGADYEIINKEYHYNHVYVIDPALTNFVEITFVDYDKKILSGSFEFNFKPSYSIVLNDTLDKSDSEIRVNFSQGRFDLTVAD